MIQVELSGTFGYTGGNRGVNGDTSLAAAAVRGASRSKMAGAANDRHPHVEPDWREE